MRSDRKIVDIDKTQNRTDDSPKTLEEIFIDLMTLKFQNILQKFQNISAPSKCKFEMFKHFQNNLSKTIKILHCFLTWFWSVVNFVVLRMC